MFQRLIQSITRQLKTLPHFDDGQALEKLTFETPPNIQLGELALPVAFVLARILKKAPKIIAQELVAPLSEIDGISRVEVAGAGYLNLYLCRGSWLQSLYQSIRAGHYGAEPPVLAPKGKIVVEHTNINPNKAAHIGHLRNAVLGDSFVRTLRFLNEPVEVQNYIDNTGVQVADVVVGFQHLAKTTPHEVLRGTQAFDHYCWDLYSKVTSFYEEDSSRLQLRYQALKAIEEGSGEIAQIAGVVATANARAHLATMERLGIYYDLLPRESDILHLHFWDTAFELLKKREALEYANEGKNAGCWIMRIGGPSATDQTPEEGDEKVIVRSNGTVTYVGKDIAYQLWKFGLLGMDFRYRPFLKYPNGHTVWITATEPVQDTPTEVDFGAAHHVYNVIDKRQSYLQEIVIEGLKALQFNEQAANSTHFSYEMVALSPNCCREMGVLLGDDDLQKPYVEVSGRRGIGVKADDLIDRLEERALAEVRSRHAVPDEEARGIAHQIAVSAIRYFMLKFTRNSIIAFDFDEALNFEGETGPYLQYSVVRANNIFKKMQALEPDCEDQVALFASQAVVSDQAEANDDIWELVLLASRLSEVARQVHKTMELAVLAKFAFNLAQKFNLFYHRYHIISEESRDRRLFLLLVVDIYRRQMTKVLDLLGIEIPERM